MASPLAAFGKVLWQKEVTIGANQDVCVGDAFYGPGVPLEFGLVSSRYGDRIFFRTSRRIIREWELPAPGQPDGAKEWAAGFVSHFSDSDTLFVEMHDAGEPVFATGDKAVRMAKLFRSWVTNSFSPNDYKEAAALGVPVERLTGPPPERICPIGQGGG